MATEEDGAEAVERALRTLASPTASKFLGFPGTELIHAALKALQGEADYRFELGKDMRSMSNARLVSMAGSKRSMRDDGPVSTADESNKRRRLIDGDAQGPPDWLMIAALETVRERADALVARILRDIESEVRSGRDGGKKENENDHALLQKYLREIVAVPWLPDQTEVMKDRVICGLAEMRTVVEYSNKMADALPAIPGRPTAENVDPREPCMDCYNLPPDGTTCPMYISPTSPVYNPLCCQKPKCRDECFRCRSVVRCRAKFVLRLATIIMGIGEKEGQHRWPEIRDVMKTLRDIERSIILTVPHSSRQQMVERVVRRYVVSQGFDAEDVLGVHVVELDGQNVDDNWTLRFATNK